MNLKVKTSEKKVGVHSLTCSIFEVKGHDGTLGWGLRGVTTGQLFTWTCTNQTTSWSMHSWSIFGAHTNHEHTQTLKIHHGLNLRELTTFPLIRFSVISHKSYIRISFCPETPKLGIPIPKIGTPSTLEGHDFLWRPLIEMRFKKSCSPCWEFFSDMWHATCMHLF
jgi:hypothetical protein